MLGYEKARLRDWGLPNHTVDICWAPLNGTSDAILDDIDYSTINRKLYTFHSYFLLSLRVFVDRLNDVLEYVSADDLSNNDQ